MPVATLVARGLALGLAFGLAVSAVDLAFAGIGVIQRRMGPGPSFLLQTVLLEIGLAALLGVLVSPLLRLSLGRLSGSALHLFALAAVWFGLGRLAPFDAPIAALLDTSPLVALVLTLLGLWLARRSAWLPWALGVGLCAAAVLVPGAYISATTPERPARAAIPPAPPGAPDVVLIVLDTTRAESLSTYGYARPTAPILDRLAQEGARFADATSPSTWSLPSHASLFTGRYPSSHGAHGEQLSLDDRYPTLAEALGAKGWETFCFTSNAWISDGLGLTRGFGTQDATWKEEAGAGRNFVFIHRFLDRLGLTEHDKGGGAVAENFATWIKERPLDAPPAFVFLNFIEAHFPYHQLPRDYLHLYTDRPQGELQDISMALMAQQFGGATQDVDEVRAPAIDMYDAGINYTDELLGRVVDAIRERGTLDDTVLVVLADHGEIMGERAGFFGHGPSLYQVGVSVPLVVRYPPRVPAGVRVDAPVSTLGAFATILDLVGLPELPTLQVGSLVPRIEGGESRGPVIAEKMGSQAMGGGGTVLPDPQMNGQLRYRAYRSGAWKLVEASNGDVFLFDLADDPREERDLAATEPEELARMQAELNDARVAIGLPPLDGEVTAQAGTTELDPATLERLRELGYVE